MALIAAGEAIKKGGRVVWMDAEDRPQTVVERARPLGLLEAVTDRGRFRFFNDADLVEVDKVEDGGEVLEVPRHLAQALAWLASAPDPRFSLTVIDSAESWGCAADGQDVAPWMVKFVDPWRKADVAVLLLDHVPKRPKDRPPGPIGSQHKRARVDGAALRCFGRCWTKAEGGAVTLANEKDRVGDLPAGMGRAVATLSGTWDASGGFAWELIAPTVETEAESEGGNDADQEIVYEAIKAAGTEGIHGWRKLRQAAEISQERAMNAADALVESGRLTREKRGQGYTYWAVGDGLTKAENDEVQAALEYE